MFHGSAPRLRAQHRRRRVLPPEQRIDDLVSAAAALFVAKGVDATTVDDIVVRAGVAKGTFYHYFDTKADVILALRERFSSSFAERVEGAVARLDRDDHPARLRAWLRSAVEAYLESVDLHDVVFHDFTHSRRQSPEKDQVLDQIQGILAEGARAGAWSVPDPRATAIVLFDGMHGVVDDAIAAGRHDAAAIVEVLAPLFDRMLEAPRRRGSR